MVSGLRSRLESAALLLLSALPALAWGRAGHATVARIAQARLTPAAQAQVHLLLEDDLDAAGRPSGRRTLAEIASWPDELRELAPKGAYQGWHTRANPVCREALGPCRDGHCVDELIVHYGQILADPAQPRRERNEALKWSCISSGTCTSPCTRAWRATTARPRCAPWRERRSNPG